MRHDFLIQARSGSLAKASHAASIVNSIAALSILARLISQHLHSLSPQGLRYYVSNAGLVTLRALLFSLTVCMTVSGAPRPDCLLGSSRRPFSVRPPDPVTT